MASLRSLLKLRRRLKLLAPNENDPKAPELVVAVHCGDKGVQYDIDHKTSEDSKEWWHVRASFGGSLGDTPCLEASLPVKPCAVLPEEHLKPILVRVALGLAASEPVLRDAVREAMAIGSNGSAGRPAFDNRVYDQDRQFGKKTNVRHCFRTVTEGLGGDDLGLLAQ